MMSHNPSQINNSRYWCLTLVHISSNTIIDSLFKYKTNLKLLHVNCRISRNESSLMRRPELQWDTLILAYKKLITLKRYKNKMLYMPKNNWA